MTPLLGSPWINAWLNDHSTSILLAGKEDLFHIEKKIILQVLLRAKMCSSAQYYYFILLMSYPLPVLRTQRKKNEEKKDKTHFLVMPCVEALPVAILSHQITGAQ